MDGGFGVERGRDGWRCVGVRGREVWGWRVGGPTSCEISGYGF